MFFENYKLDQAVKNVEYVNNDPKQGGLITIENVEQMAMPVILQYETESGTKNILKIPVEVWQNNTSWIIKVSTNEKIKSVIIDPGKEFPDINFANNIWSEP